MFRIPTQRTPTHPGEMLLEEFLKPMNLTQRDLADAIHVPYQRINEIINGRRGITPGTALRLAKFFGVSAGFCNPFNPLPRPPLEQQSAREKLRR